MPRVLISGASGLIGSALVPAFEAQGAQVYRLVRKQPRSASELWWDPMQSVSPELVSGYDAAIHLSGETVAGRWTDAKKKLIRDSRVVSTQNLSHALATAEKKPAVFICASAIGYYGDRGDEILTEESASGSGYLPSVCREWEAATQPASNAGIRVVNLRIGIVLSCKGGALEQMLWPFRLGLGGRIGSGNQWWSWIHIDDLVTVVHHILGTSSLCGPVNLVSPHSATNAEFTDTLGRVLRRRAILAVPAFAARLAFGEFADEGLLAGARVVPDKLIRTGFGFRHPDLAHALAAEFR